MAASPVAFLLIAAAGLLGAAGVSLAAAAAHVMNGEATRAAAEVAMVHAAAVVGIVAISHHVSRGGLWRAVAAVMLLGAALFSGTVAAGTLADWRPLPTLAPIGGSLTILSWLAVTAVALFDMAATRRDG